MSDTGSIKDVQAAAVASRRAADHARLVVRGMTWVATAMGSVFLAAIVPLVLMLSVVAGILILVVALAVLIVAAVGTTRAHRDLRALQRSEWATS